MDLGENLIKEVFKNILNIELKDFPVMTYSDAIKKFGSDKPDLRNPLELIDVKDIFYRLRI